MCNFLLFDQREMLAGLKNKVSSVGIGQAVEHFHILASETVPGEADYSQLRLPTNHSGLSSNTMPGYRLEWSN